MKIRFEEFTEPSFQEKWVLQRLPVTLRVAWYHDTQASALRAKTLAESRGMQVRILHIKVECTELKE